MSTLAIAVVDTTAEDAARRKTIASLALRLRRALAAIVQGIQAERNRRAARAELMQLSPRMLKDIGIDRNEIDALLTHPIAHRRWTR